MAAACTLRAPRAGPFCLLLLWRAAARGDLRQAELAAAEAGRLSTFYAITGCAEGQRAALGCCGAGGEGPGGEPCGQDLSLLQVTAGAYHRAPGPGAAASLAAAAGQAQRPSSTEASGAGDDSEAEVADAEAAEEAAEDAESVKPVGRAVASGLGPQTAVEEAAGVAAAVASRMEKVRQVLGPQVGREEARREEAPHDGGPRLHAAPPLPALAPALLALGEFWGRLPSLPVLRVPAKAPAATAGPLLQQQDAAVEGLVAADSAVGAAELAGSAAAEGDVVQGLVFTLICLIIVIGIYLLVFNEHRPGEVGVPMTFDRAGSVRPSSWRWPSGGSAAALLAVPKFGGTVSRLTSAKSLSGRETLQAASATQISRWGGMPGTPPSTLPTPQEKFSSIVGGSAEDEWYTEFPMIYPQLVIPAAHTRMAVPLAQLWQPSFVLDILSRGGSRLLNAQLRDDLQVPAIQICGRDGGLLASVTSELEILGRDGALFGVLSRERVSPQLGLADCLQLVFRDARRRPISVLVATRRDVAGCDFKLHSISAGRLVERATAVRRPAQPPPHGKLPGEHYEVVVNPRVDAVLVLTILMGAVIFGMPPPTSTGTETARNSVVADNDRT